MEHKQHINSDLSLILKNKKITPGKKKVLLSSINLFSKYGFNGVSTSEIARHANVSEATIYKYFTNKKALLMEIITPIIENCLPVYENMFAGSLDKGNFKLKDLVHYIVDDRIKFLKTNKEIISILLSEMIINDEVRELLINNLDNSHVKNAEKILQVFIRTNELASDITYNSLLRIIMGQLLIYFTQIYLFKSEYIEQQHLEQQIYRSLKRKEG